MDEELLELIRQGGQGRGVSVPGLGPIELTPEIEETATVIDTKAPNSKRAIKNAIQKALLGSSFTPGQAVSGSGNRGGSSNASVPNSPLRTEEDPVQQLLKGINDPSVLRGREPIVNNLGDTAFQNDSVSQSPRAVSSGGFIRPTEEQKELGENENLPQPRLSDIDFSNFEGTKIEGKTPVGTPEPEELQGFSKAISNFGKALETPGFQRFLSQMGIAFSGGRPNEPGTILGQFNIQQLDSQLEEQLTQGLLEGKTLDEIDLPETPNSEVLNRALENVRQQRALDLQERGLEDTERRTDLQESGQEFEEFYSRERLRQLERQLDIQEGQLDVSRAKIIGDRLKDMKPDDVEVGEFGIAMDIIGQKYVDIANKFRREELGEEFQKLSELQKVFSNEKTGFQPEAVMQHLPQNVRARALDEAQTLARGLSTSFQGGNEPLQGVASFTVAQNAQEVASFSDGTTFQTPDGGIWMKQGDRNIPLNDVAEQRLRR